MKGTSILSRCLLTTTLFVFAISFSRLKAQSDVILQGFYWNTVPGDVTNTTTGGVWWDTIAGVAPQLSAAGFKTVWTPPANKGFAGVFDMGYGVFDYFDYGQFNQNGTTRTRHGNLAQFQNMMNALHGQGLLVMADVVLNHRAGAAETQAEECDHDNNTIREQRYTKFRPASTRLYMDSLDFHPNNTHCDLLAPYHDRSFFEDICYFNQIDQVLNPGGWYFGPHNLGKAGDSLIIWGRNMLDPVNGPGFDELRLDAVKHVEPGFMAPFLVESFNGTQPFAVGELFDSDLGTLKGYRDAVEGYNVAGPGLGSKDANLAIFDFNLRYALRDMCNGGGGYNMWNLNSTGLHFNPAGGLPGEDIVTFVDNHDVDRIGFSTTTCDDPLKVLTIGATCLKYSTDSGHDPVFSDKDDMAYPYIMAAQGRPTVFWKDWFWFGLNDDIQWQMALRNATAGGDATPIQSLSPFFTAGNGGDLFVMTRAGGGGKSGLVLALNDNPSSEAKVFVNTPFNNKYLKDYSDGYLFQFTQAFGDSRAEVKAQSRDYAWWAPTGLYPKSPGTAGSHFNMDATPGGCPHFVVLCVADAANLLVNGAPIAAGDEVAVKNGSGQVVGIGRIGQGFQWDGTHDMIIEVLGSPSVNGMNNGEMLHWVVYDQSANQEVIIDFVQYAAVGNNFTFSADRPASPNRNGNFASFPLATDAQGLFTCGGISRVLALSAPVPESTEFCSAVSQTNASAYDDGWQAGDNDGSGFLAWTAINTPNGPSGSGVFIGSSAMNGDGDGNGDGDINTGGEAWALYANSGNTADATRPFAVPMNVGSTFSLRMDNGFIDNGGVVGFGLRNSSGENLMEFYFTGGTGGYTINDASVTVTGIPFTDEGLQLDIELATASTYNLKVTNLNGGTVTTINNRSLKNPGGGQTIDRVRIFNFNAGNNAERNAFFNAFQLCYPPAMVINEVDYDQPGGDANEYIELKNVSSAAINVDPYKLELVNGGGTVYATLELPNANVSPGGYYVVNTNNQIDDGPASIRLVLNNSVTVDAVAYEGAGVTPGDNDQIAGLAIARVPDGTDSDANSDFQLTCGTSGSANTPDNTDTDNDAIPDACDTCPLAKQNDIPANFNTATCACEPGYYAQTTVENGQTVIIGCSLCPPGQFCPDGVQAIPCPAGRYSNVSGATACIPCEAGYYSDVTGATACIACEAGKYQGQTGSTSCLSCPAGTFSDVIGAEVCQSCPEGKYQSLEGQTSCLSCAAGTFSDAAGSVVCQSCPAGQYQSLEGQTSCLSCAAGTFSDAAGSVVCQSCPAGKYQSLPGQTSCLSCAAGTFSDAVGSEQCTACAAGTYQDQEGQTACLNCPSGTNSAPGSSVCTPSANDPQAITVRGNGIAIANRAASGNLADGTDFGNVSVSGGQVTHTFSIENIINGLPLKLDGVPLVTVADIHASDFLVTQPLESSIPGGSSTTFTVTFDPTAPGMRSAILVITHNDLPENPFIFTVHGTGL